MGFTFDVKKSLQVQPRPRSTSEGIPGLEAPDTGAGTRTREQETSQEAYSGGRGQSGGTNIPSSDTDLNALPAFAGTVRSGIGVGGVRNTRGSGPGGVLRGGRGIEIPGGVYSEDDNRSDYATLDASLRDLYLTGSHGLTSLYPTILLTSPHSSKVIDVNAGLTSTPFIIDLNNTIKKTIESDVRATISQFAPTLQLSTVAYDQNLNVAKQYADLCLRAAQSKDRLIALTNVINTNIVDGPNQDQSIVIGGENYQFLKGLPDVLSFIDSIHEEFDSEDFIEGSGESVNTRAFLQVLKILYNQLLLGSFYLPPSHRSDRNNKPNKLWGQIERQITQAVYDLQNLQKIDDADREVVDLTTLSLVNFKDTQSTNKLSDLVRIVQRDLIMQASKAQISNIFSTPASTSVQNDLSRFIGKYKNDDVAINTKSLEDFSTGYEDVDTFTASLPIADVSTFLVQNDGTKIFNVLDTVGGHDYLLYDELSRETNDVTLDNLTNFSNRYTQFAIKLRSFYQIIFRDDNIRNKCLSIIATNFISFFNSSITREEFTSEASGVRMGLLFAAADDDDISKKLFEFICAPSGIKVRKANDLLIKCELKGTDGIKNDGTLATNPSGEDAVSDGGVGWEDIESEYLKNIPDARGTSFGMFHAIADEIERELASGSLGSDTKTSQSLSLSRNARAFVFYQMFLDMLRCFYFRVQFDRENVRPSLERLSVEYIEPRIRIYYKPTQAIPVRYALERYNKTRTQLENDLSSIINSTTSAFRDDVRKIYDKYLSPITEKINEQEQNCLDIVNLLVSHSAQISQEVATLTSSINSIKSISRSAAIINKESIMNSIQTEQAFLKKNIVDRYSYPLRGAQYLPSALDHNVNQALNVKTAVLTLPILNDSPTDSITRKFMIAVGIPTGLMENLRYQNALSTNEHLYRIDLVFKNLQISQRDEDDNTVETFATVSKTFSTRIFINEGYQLAGGADVVSSTLANYQQIYDATKYKYVDDEGNYLDASPGTLELMLGDKKIVENHLLSHYSKLYLKTTSGITLDESEFDLVPQVRRYPDPEQDANYTTIADNISMKYPDTIEGQLNKDRVLRDLSRATTLSPEQHKISMMTAKTFERIHVIPVDINDIIDTFETNTDYVLRDDLAFISVVAKIQLEDSQPPMSMRQSPTRRSYTQATTDVESAFKQTDFRSQGADVVGINKMIELNNKFGGFMGGRR